MGLVMTETRWTPGPWKVNPKTPSTVVTPDGMISVSWSSTDGHYERLAEANANLIAAAPDLYDALDRCLNFIENTEGEIGATLECGDKARAALAKACGEQ